MTEPPRAKERFVGYDYQEVPASDAHASLYLDGYEQFGWIRENRHPERGVYRLKRDRKIVNKTELTRLQRHFEACVRDIKLLERSEMAKATRFSLAIGIIGTAFMAGSTFAVTQEPPIVWLCILLAIPGFTGWILPCLLYRRLRGRLKRKTAPLIEAKYDELYEVCEKGHALLH